jgi:hypothetical protein
MTVSDRVVALDNQPVGPDTAPSNVTQATEIKVRSPDGTTRVASFARSAPGRSPLIYWNFFGTALLFLLVSCAFYLLDSTPNPTASWALLLLTVSVSVAFTSGIATAFGRGWALVAIICESDHTGGQYIALFSGVSSEITRNKGRTACYCGEYCSRDYFRRMGFRSGRAVARPLPIWISNAPSGGLRTCAALRDQRPDRFPKTGLVFASAYPE